MKRFVLFLLLPLAASVACAQTQSVNFIFDGNQVKDSSGDPLADNSLVLLLVNTGGSDSGFNILSPGSLSLYSTLDGSYEVIGRTGVDAGDYEPGAFSGSQVISYTGAITSGEQLAVVWIPSASDVDVSGNTLNADESYGLYIVNSSSLWQTPGVGQNTFEVTVSEGTGASFTATAVPEPATYAAIAAALSLGLVIVGRRRRSTTTV